jgi:hypothetical protein
MRSCLVAALAVPLLGCVLPHSMALGQMAAPVGRGAMEVGVFSGIQFGGQSDPPLANGASTSQKSTGGIAAPAAEANLQYGFNEHVALNVHASPAGIQPGVKWTVNTSKVAHFALLPQVAAGYGSYGSTVYLADASGVQTPVSPESRNAFSFLVGLKALVSHRSGFYAGVGYDFQMLRSRATFSVGTGTTTQDVETVSFSTGHQISAALGMDIAFGMIHLRPEVAFAVTPGIASTHTTRIAGSPDSVLSGGGGFAWAVMPGFTIAVASPRREKTAAEEEAEAAAEKKKRRRVDDDDDEDDAEDEAPAKRQRRGGGDDDENRPKRRSGDDDE